MSPESSYDIIGFPVELARFIGRERELAALRALAGSSRLLTLTGAGGSGKSRLALELAPHLASLAADGIAWVELAPCTDATLIDDEILCVLDPTAEHGETTPEMLISWLRERSFLLVLDNCEHLVQPCAELVDSMLRSCPKLHIIATSREALGVPGERAWLVPPLALPDPETELAALEQYDAVRLFVDRAREVSPEFAITPENAAAVNAICRRLDGIPLAIQLAAARVRAMTPHEIAARLGDAFALLTSRARTVVPRHRTLRAAVDWSYELLEPDARAVLRRLSVFRGGFTLDAVEAVCVLDDVVREDVLELVTLLLDRSLIVMREQGSGARYSLLEVMRQYAQRQLDAAGERERVEAAFARYIGDMVRAAEPAFATARRARVCAALEAELDNIREVLAWTRTHDAAEHSVLVGCLWWFWFSTRFWTEARHWFDGALSLPPAQQPRCPRASLLFASGALYALQARTEPARAALEEAMALAQGCGNEKLEAYARNYYAMTFAGLGDPAGITHAQAAADWLRAHDDLYGLRLALLLVGMGHCAAGDAAAGHAAMREAVVIARRVGQPRELAIALQTLAMALLDAGISDECEALLLEAVAALRQDISWLFMARALDALGLLLAAREPELAARLVGSTDATRRALGARRFALDQRRTDAMLPVLRARLGEAAYEHWYRQGEAQPMLELVAEVLQRAPSVVANVETAPAGAAETSPDLRIRALGGLEVWVRGERLGAWPYARPKELLLLLATYPRGRTRIEITDALWPDVPPTQARNNFHVTLHHLRKALGQPEWIVVEHERYRIAPQLAVEFDAALFDQEMRALLEQRTEDTSALARALSRYGGTLMAGESAAAWRQDEEDRLRRLYCDGALRVGELLEREQRFTEAAAAYEAALAHEPLLEEAHRRLMALWLAGGERYRALRHYERFTTVLRALRLEPEPETARLIESA